MKKLFLLCTCLLLAIPCQAEIITVDDDGPADFNNIQNAIDYSLHGDTVIVKSGTYNEIIYFNGKAITLTSEDPINPNIVESTIIQAGAMYGVIFDFGEGSASVITGFTIYQCSIRCYASSPTISNNIITENDNVSGITGQYGASPTICNNLITYNDGKTEGSLVVGGGIRGCNGLITNNIISWNQARRVSGRTSYGGGLYACNGTIVNNVIVHNFSDHYGGAIANCDADVFNNIIAYNEVDHSSPSGGGGIYGECNSQYNCFYMNTGGHFSGGALPGIGDFASDPLFADLDNEDYHLQSMFGRWEPNSQTWIQDDVNSPCIDAGDPNSDWMAELWPHGTRINIGAYGGTAEASMSALAVGDIADLNNDDIVNLQDFACIAGAYQAEGFLLSEDLNRDNQVNGIDLSIFVGNWLWGE
ncbi:MAG: hypothetical protein ACYS1A_16470 [Planctomycetota bacterium]|jgi:hypothetical protein